MNSKNKSIIYGDGSLQLMYNVMKFIEKDLATCIGVPYDIIQHMLKLNASTVWKDSVQFWFYAGDIMVDLVNDDLDETCNYCSAPLPPSCWKCSQCGRWSG